MNILKQHYICLMSLNTTSQKAEAVPVIPNLPHQPEPIAVVSAPSAVDNTVYVAGMNHEERAPAPQSTYSPQAGSLRRPTHELARSMLNDPEQSRSPLAEPPKVLVLKHLSTTAASRHAFTSYTF